MRVLQAALAALHEELAEAEAHIERLQDEAEALSAATEEQVENLEKENAELRKELEEATKSVAAPSPAGASLVAQYVSGGGGKG